MVSYHNRTPSVGIFENGNSLPFVHMLILSSAFLSAMLRLNEDSDVTLFRILLPLVLLFIAMYDRLRLVYLVAILSYVAFCQAISFYFTPYSINFYNIAFFLNYLVMIIVGFYIYIIDTRFNRESIDRFCAFYFYILLAALIAQLVFNFNLPNISDAGEAANAWYGNENDASLALAAFVFYAARFGLLRKHVVGIILATFVMYENGSRTCMLSIAILMYYVIIKRFGVVITAYFTVLSAAILVGFLEYFVEGFSIVSEVLEFLDNFFIAISNLLKLEVTPGLITSLDIRSMAAALALIDFSNHPLFGIGAGNTISLIEQNGSIFNYVIRSTHNMPLMILAELGILGTLAFFYPIFRISRLGTWSFIFWLSLYLFSSLSQSGGFMTNFFVLVTLILVIARPEHVTKSGGRSLTGVGLATHSN